LWSKSRHRNHFGESELWTGIATAAAGVLMSDAGQTGMGFANGLPALNGGHESGVCHVLASQGEFMVIFYALANAIVK